MRIHYHIRPHISLRIRPRIRHRHRQVVLRLILVFMGVLLALAAGWTIASASL